MEKGSLNLGLEAARFFWCLLVGMVLFLFFTLLLDVVAYLAYGGWNPLLGSWPVFGGTISAAVYGSKGPVVVLLVCYGILCRMIAGPVLPGIMRALRKDGAA